MSSTAGNISRPQSPIQNIQEPSASNGASTALNGASQGQKKLENVVNSGKPETDKAKDHLDKSAQNLMGAAGSTANALAEETEGLKNDGKEVVGGVQQAAGAIAEKTKNTAEDVADRTKEASRGVLGAIKAPFVYTSNKLGNVIDNVSRNRGEAINPWMSGVALLTGAGIYTLAKAASWGATFFVTTPALGLGLASLAAVHLAWTIGSRMWNGAPARATTEGVVENNDPLHMFMSLRNSEAKKLKEEQELLAKSFDSELESLAAANLENAKRVREISIEKAKAEQRIAAFENLNLRPVAPVVTEGQAIETVQVNANMNNDVVKLAATGEGHDKAEPLAGRTTEVKTVAKEVEVKAEITKTAAATESATTNAQSVLAQNNAA